LHADGKVRSTARRRPLTLVYYEACHHEDDAFRRERFLKTGKGKRFLRRRLAAFWEEHASKQVGTAQVNSLTLHKPA